MIRKTCSILLAAALTAAPMSIALAQSNTAGGTSTVPRAAPSNPQMNSSSPATNPRQPGATGQTVVKGSTSSMAGSHRIDPNPATQAENPTPGGIGGAH